MTVTHQPNPDLLLDYAAGSLDEGLSLFVASHLALCPESRRTVTKAEAIGGALIEDIAPEPMGSNSLDQVLARLDETAAMTSDATQKNEPQMNVTDTDIPSPLRHYLDTPLESLPWRRLGPGVQQVDVLPPKNDRRVSLLKIAPGLAVPEHGHHGPERTLILRGSYRDALGEFKRGDVADLDVSVEHQPIAGTEEACICLVVTDAPVKLKGFWGRLLQPFIRY